MLLVIQNIARKHGGGAAGGGDGEGGGTGQDWSGLVGQDVVSIGAGGGG